MDELQQQQQRLLTAHRNRLAALLDQQAVLGVGHTPPGVVTDIDAARTEILRIKAYLREHNVAVEDLPDDDPPPAVVLRSLTPPAGLGDIVGGDKITLGDISGKADIAIGRKATIDKRSGFFVGRTRIALVVVSVIVLLFLLFGAVIAGANIPGLTGVAQQSGLISAFPAEQPGETLLIIATFRYTEGNRNTVAHEEIRRAIREVLKTTDVPNLRVEIAPVVLAADDRDGTEQLGAHYNASIVIWGEDTGARVTVNFLNRREPTSYASDVVVNETERVQIARPDAYASFITHDLPQRMTFLSLFAVGQSAFAQEDYPTATRVISNALGIVKDIALSSNDTADADFWGGVTDAYFQLGWLYQVPGQDAERAVQSYDQAIALDPQHAMAYNNRGIARSDQGDLAGAVKDYDQAIALDPQYADAYNNRGVARRAQGDLVGAVKDYDQAIALNPQHADAYNNRGIVRKAQGDLAGAVKDYDQAIVLNPQHADAYNNRGVARRAQGDLAGAVKDYDQAIVLNPQDAMAYYNRGIARFHQGDLVGAVKDYDQAIALNPQYVKAYKNRGSARRAQGDLVGAVKDFDQAIALDPQDADAYYNRGIARSDQGDLVGAVKDFDQVIALDPQDADAYYNRGVARSDQGDLAGAVKDFDQAIAFDPQDVDAYNSLCWWGSLLDRAADPTIITACEQAVALASDQDRPNYVDSRGLNRALRGDNTGAIEDFTAFLTWARPRGATDEHIAKIIVRREALLKALRAGQNPFDAAILQSLREE